MVLPSTSPLLYESHVETNLGSLRIQKGPESDLPEGGFGPHRATYQEQGGGSGRIHTRAGGRFSMCVHNRAPDDSRVARMGGDYVAGGASGSSDIF